MGEMHRALQFYAERRNYCPPAPPAVAPPEHLMETDAYDGEGPGARARSALRTAQPDYLADVRLFHEIMPHPIGDHIFIGTRKELRARLIEEEAKEAGLALLLGDVPATIKELCDVLYVVFGTFLEMGVNPTPFWNEVQRSNLTKAGGEQREDGKQLKPAHYSPADIDSILDQEYAKEDGAWISSPE